MDLGLIWKIYKYIVIIFVYIYLNYFKNIDFKWCFSITTYLYLYIKLLLCWDYRGFSKFQQEQKKTVIYK